LRSPGADTPGNTADDQKVKEYAMQYHWNSSGVNPSPRTVDPHSLVHARMSKSALAIIGADLLDGRRVLSHLTYGIAASAVKVSVLYLARARRLTPEQRQDVWNGRRPLFLPRPVAPLPIILAVPASPEKKLQDIVAELGMTETLELLARIEQPQLIMA
jgi:hypothetical protein